MDSASIWMIRKLKSSLLIFAELLRGSISSIFGFLFTLYGLFAAIRDEFLSPEIAKQLRLGGLVAMITWYWWVIIGLFLLWIGTAWKATKKIVRLQNEIDSNKKVNIAISKSQ